MMKCYLRIKNNVLEMYLFKFKDFLLLDEKKSNYNRACSIRAHYCLKTQGYAQEKKSREIYTNTVMRVIKSGGV